MDADIVTSARTLVPRHPGLSARDLVHLATCIVDDADECWTYDRALSAAYP